MAIAVSPYIGVDTLYEPRVNVLRVLSHDLPENRSGLYGVELELDWRRKPSALSAIEKAFHDLPCFIAKRDGSICGTELVTVPMTLEDHLTFIESLQDNAVLKNLQATRKDGMHVHVDRTHLSEGVILHLVLMMLVPGLQGWLDTVCRRKANEYCERYAMLPHDTAADLVNQTRHLLKHPAKRSAVNLVPKDTIEFRMFHGTTSPVSYMRTIETVSLLIAYTRWVSSNHTALQAIEQGLYTPGRLISYTLEHLKLYPRLCRWFRTSDRFTQWVTPEMRHPRQAGFAQNHLLGRTKSPTHGDVLAARASLDATAYVSWYMDFCGGEYISASGVSKTGRALARHARHHARLVDRCLKRRLLVANGDQAKSTTLGGLYVS